jgi:hypothetical protein
MICDIGDKAGRAIMRVGKSSNSAFRVSRPTVDYSSDMVRGLWPILNFLMSSWHLLPRSHVFRKRRKACQPIPGSSSCMAVRRSVGQRSSMLLCRCCLRSHI